MSASIESLTEQFLFTIRSNVTTPEFLFQQPLYDTLLDLIYSGVNPNTQSSHFGYNLLHLCVLAQAYDKIETLLNCGVDPNHRDQLDAYTPLTMLLNQDPIDYMAAQALIEAGANPNTTDKLGQTLLHHATKEKNLSMIVLALNLGVDPGIKSQYGFTAISALQYLPTEYFTFEVVARSTELYRNTLATELELQSQKKQAELATRIEQGAKPSLSETKSSPLFFRPEDEKPNNSPVVASSYQFP